MILACFRLPGKKQNFNIALIIPVKATMASSERFFSALFGTWGFPRLEALDDRSEFVGIGFADEFVVV